MTDTLILASTSPFRKHLLSQAGIAFDTEAAAIDERAIEADLHMKGAGPVDVARRLAEEKALEVSRRRPSSLVIGSDQTLSLADRVYHKPVDRTDAARHLASFSGKTHQLNSGVALARNGVVIWSEVVSARMGVRDLSPDFIERYLDRVGEKVFRSVGAYQLEGEGIQLFSAIDGDYFTIVGLPLLTLLGKLRELGAIDG